MTSHIRICRTTKRDMDQIVKLGVEAFRHVCPVEEIKYHIRCITLLLAYTLYVGEGQRRFHHL